MEIRQATRQEVEQAQAEGKSIPPLVPLGMDLRSCASKEEMHRNFYATLKRGYRAINEVLEKSSGTVSLVGAGPSLQDTHKELGGDILAVNSAIGFLLDHGIVPKWGMLWDAAEIVEKFVRPHPDITYLVASRCHPKVFERLKNSNVLVWHAGGDHDIVEVMNRPEVIARQKQPEPLINGGSAGVTRGIFVAVALGYMDLIIHGADSSYGPSGDTHVMGSLVPEKDTLISIGNDPPIWFRTTPEWTAQVEEYKQIYLFMLNHGVTMTVKGEGMLPMMHRLLVAKRELRGHEQFVKDMAEAAIERNALNEMASKLAENMPCN